ncbi:MAG TPA: RnfABCDGE type electron transport complex subunit G [Cyclobacteriaceae bacterium]|nr:RnfABCDGE type electron transport complex subunit G [Cyclobacteriaceae bacterium]
MAKTESTFINMLITLFVITLVASTALAYIYDITKEPIAAAEAARKQAAISNVINDYDNDPVSEMYKVASPFKGDSLECYPARKEGKLAGMAIRTISKKGYSGSIWLMVGITADGKINNIEVLDHKETPGLGAKMKELFFKDQFRNVDPSIFRLKVKKDGGDVDAITAATISSRAFCEATQLAVDTFNNKEIK